MLLRLLEINKADWQVAYGSVHVPSLAGLTAQSCVPAALLLASPSYQP